MSAHCSYCGTDLVYTDEYPVMECPCCTKAARIAALEAELAKYVRAMNIADGERDELRRKLTTADAAFARAEDERIEYVRLYEGANLRAEKAETERE